MTVQSQKKSYASSKQHFEHLKKNPLVQTTYTRRKKYQTNKVLKTYKTFQNKIKMTSLAVIVIVFQVVRGFANITNLRTRLISNSL